MLNESLCKKCITKGAWSVRDSADGRAWSRGFVICHACSGAIAVKDEPPNVCPFALEHLMSEDKPNAT